MIQLQRWNHLLLGGGDQSGNRDSNVSSYLRIMSFQTGQRERGNMDLDVIYRDLFDQDFNDSMHRLDFSSKQSVHSGWDTYGHCEQGCRKMKVLTEGKKVPAYIGKSDQKGNFFSDNTLTSVLANGESLVDGWNPFFGLPDENVSTQKAMIVGYVKQGLFEEAAKLFWKMEPDGAKLDEVTFVSMLKACARLGDLELGKRVHRSINASGVKLNLSLGNAILDMYARIGNMEGALQVFDTMPVRDVFSWNAMITGCAHDGHGEEAFKRFQQMDCDHVKPDKVTFVNILRVCARHTALREGRQIHGRIIEYGYAFDIFVGSTLVDMYAKCGCMEDACQVFEKLPERDVVSWNAMIAGHARHGCGESSLKLFTCMQKNGVKPSKVTYLSALRACSSPADLKQGKWVHVHIIESGHETNMFIGSSLIEMYAKCMSLEDAQIVFFKLSTRDTVLWNTMITAYVDHGHGAEGLKLFQQMQQEGVRANKVSFMGAMKACGILAALELGKQIHACIIQTEYEMHLSVKNTLVNMYGKCGSLEDARQVFDRISERDIVSWNAMITGYSQHGFENDAVELFQRMQQEGVKPNMITFVSVLSLCASLDQGKQLHSYIVELGSESNVFVVSALVDMYVRFRCLENACQVFEKVVHKDVVLWNAIITGYAKHGLEEEAMQLFKQMQKEDVKPNEVTFVSMLNACSSLEDLNQGRDIHRCIRIAGYESEMHVESALIDMYSKCRSLKEAENVFNRMPNQDVVSWTAMIIGYSQHGKNMEAIQIFQQMHEIGLKPDEVTYVGILNACASIEELEQGIEIHSCVINVGNESHLSVGNALIDMYAKCGNIDHACHVFNRMPFRDVISWNTMIFGCAQCGHGEDALRLFHRMEEEAVMPNGVTFLSVLNACACLGSLDKGKLMHAQFIKSSIKPNVSICNALVDMYAKCGSIDDACQVFGNICELDSVSWNTMIAGYAQHGHAREALHLFQQMQYKAVKMDHLTSVSVLSACSHSGLVDEGCKLFYSMSHEYGIEPAEQHYACLVDLLGRAGRLNEAYDFIFNMPFPPGPLVWKTLLGACRNSGDLKLAEDVSEVLVKLVPKDAAMYVLLSNMHSAAGK